MSEKPIAEAHRDSPILRRVVFLSPVVEAESDQSTKDPFITRSPPPLFCLEPSIPRLPRVVVEGDDHDDAHDGDKAKTTATTAATTTATTAALEATTTALEATFVRGVIDVTRTPEIPQWHHSLTESPTSEVSSSQAIAKGKEGRRRSKSVKDPLVNGSQPKEYRRRKSDDSRSSMSRSPGFASPTTAWDPKEAFENLRRMETRLDELHRIVLEYRSQLQRQEVESEKLSMGYARFIPLVSNFLMGKWIFWTRFLILSRRELRYRPLKSIFGLQLPMFLWKSRSRSRQSTQIGETYIQFVVRCALTSLPHGVLIFFSGYLMSSYRDSICIAGFLLSVSYCLTLAIRGQQVMPWANYFVVLTNALCIVARFLHKFNNVVPLMG
eukprot:TRINITY_DN10864_c0_g1_i1.p1 TRINITY_DN10864_c0_g1~~TRINITY_DN10864_c0_g1_i1.p1  ORF type:complete len:382 (+),score=68.53 TRINITY_DN10864_c0_g1_i1:39-1184(+)